MHNLSKTISEHIERQFPAIYREDGPVLVDFIKAYYEYLEQTNNATNLSRSMFQNRDIDETLDDFIFHFKEKYLNQFPYVKAIDNRFAIKHIMDFYRSKGSAESVKLLIRMLFNEEATVYLPGDDVFKLSDSKWKIPKYLELTYSPRNVNFISKQITGITTGARAFVEGLTRKRVQGRYIDVMYLSKIEGTFSTGELISDDRTITNAPRVIGSLSSMTVVNGGQDNEVGDVFDVIDNTGRQAKFRVTGIENQTGRVNFNLVDGGTGYTLNEGVVGGYGNYTDIRVATAMISCDNSNTSNQFIQFEKVIQEKNDVIISGTSANDFITAYQSNQSGYVEGVETFVEQYAASGDTTFLRSTESDVDEFIVTVDDDLVSPDDYTSNSTHVIFNDPVTGTVKIVEYVVVANGRIVSIATDEETTHSTVVIAVDTGTFGSQVSLDFANNFSYEIDEIVYEESTISIEVDDASVYTSYIGDKFEMKVYSDIANNDIVSDTPTDYLTQYAYGYIEQANTTSNVIVLKPAWGTFIAGENGGIYAANGNVVVEDEIISESNDVPGAAGILSSNTDANTAVVEVVYGAFNAGNKVLGQRSWIEEEITLVTPIGISELWFNGNTSANAVILSSSNTSATGIVVGQNTTSVGLYGNTTSFVYVEGAGLKIKTAREEIKDYNLIETPNLELDILRVGTGSGATFQPGSLENEETVTLNTDLIGANNVTNQAFLDIRVGPASNSGIGIVADFTINDGGSGYTVGDAITFTGGGYAGGNPKVNAYGEVSVVNTNSGAIESIAILNPGWGYWQTPSFTVAGGTDADLTLNMHYGYGFRKSPYGNSDTEFQHLFTFGDFTMGTITSLTRINPGSDYNTDPFISLHNKYIAGYQRRDLYLDVIADRSFRVGEILEQDGSQVGIVKSVVRKSDITGNTDDDGNKWTIGLKRTRFNINFSTSIITGDDSGAEGEIYNYSVDPDVLAMGENAVVTGKVIVASGVATSLDIIDSGYGYLNNRQMSLSRPGHDYDITAISSVRTQGTGEGYWQTNSSQISDISKIHDNKYYQEYSYDIQTGVSLNKYRDIVKKVLHVSGTEIFGSIIKNSDINIPVTPASSTTDTVSLS